MARVGLSSWGKLLVMAMLVISVAGGRPSSPSKPAPRQQSCAVYHPGMEGRVGHNDKGTVCCPVGCGECGGIGCKKNLPRGLNGEDCCVTGVLQSQGRCSDRGAKAPCIIKRGPGKPSRPTKPIPPKKKPSPPKKKPSPPRNKPSPPKNKPSPPKNKPSPPQKSCHVYHPGMKGRVGHNDKGTVCCPPGCGECGGIGCKKNLPRGLNGEDCCVTGVLQSQGRCSDHGAKAPCIIKRGPGKPSRPTKPIPPKKKPSPPKKKPSPPKKKPSPPRNKPSPPKNKPSPPKNKPSPPQKSCHVYHPGMKGRVGHNDKGTVCCPPGCGECGGIGCKKNLPRGLNGEDCCVTGVLQSQGRCSDHGAKAPCIIKRGPGKPSRPTKPIPPKKKPSPPKKKPSPPKKKPSPPRKKPSPPKKKPSPPKKKPSPPRNKPSPPKNKPSPPKNKPSPPQKSCHVYHPGMKGRVGHNDKGTVCCPLGCGECGGIGCKKDLPRGLNGEDCCVTGVLQSQGRCSDRGAKAPCIIKRGPGKPSRPTKPSAPKKKPSPPKKKPSPPKKKPSPPKNKPSPPKNKPSPPKNKPSPPKNKPSPPKNKPRPPRNKPSPPKNKPSPPQKSCHVYHPGMKGRVGHNDKGTVCCPLGCGECGGIGCKKNLPRGLSREDCCVTGVLQSQGRCSDRGAKAPCIIKGPKRRTGGPKKRKGSKH